MRTDFVYIDLNWGVEGNDLSNSDFDINIRNKGCKHNLYYSYLFFTMQEIYHDDMIFIIHVGVGSGTI